MTPSPPESARLWAQRGAIAAPWAGLLLGLAAIAVADRGAGTRPALAVLVLALGALAGLVPFRLGLPVAVVLASFGGFYMDFVGWHAGYWNELFVLGIAARGALARRPARWELLAAGGFAAVYLGYLAAGAAATAVFWGAKVLLLPILAGWGIWRLRPAVIDWLATYYGLATMVAAGIVLSVWQRHEGVTKLRALGLTDDRLRTTGGGELRIFAGFISASPFAYALALGALSWLAALLSPTARATALATIWVPVAALVGIAWASNRLALLMVLSAAAAVAATEAIRQPRARLVLLGATGVLAALVLAVAAAGALSSRSAAFRTELWRGYLAEFSAGGAGPAASGSAFEHAHYPAYHPPLTFGPGWPENFVRGPTLYRGMGTNARLAVGGGEGDARPPLTLVATTESIFRGRTLTVALRGRRLIRIRVPANRSPRLAFRIPPGEGTAAVWLHASPPAQPVAGPSSTKAAIRLGGAEIRGVPEPPTATLRVYHHVWSETQDPQNHLQGISPGVVDSQYVSWLFSYGLLGGVLGLLWVAVLVAPAAGRRPPGPAALAAAFCGCFVALAGLAVNIWEESPTDLLTAILVAQGYAGLRLSHLLRPLRGRREARSASSTGISP